MCLCLAGGKINQKARIPDKSPRARLFVQARASAPPVGAGLGKSAPLAARQREGAAGQLASGGSPPRLCALLRIKALVFSLLSSPFVSFSSFVLPSPIVIEC